ncbi:MAG: hypothetical protein VKM97_07450 [Cyanobacteriota bacterium]|nr:hypothetical protein [Cyanobacteriota bacterium]
MAEPTPEQQAEQQSEQQHEQQSEQQHERYAAIELLYSEGRWPEVLAAGEALLASLATLQHQPLRCRLQLLIGHTLLYGLADPDGAEQRYRAVLQNSDDAVVREIADRGLQDCSEQGPAAAERKPAAAAMPWLADLDAGPQPAAAPEPIAASSITEEPEPRTAPLSASAVNTLALLRQPNPSQLDPEAMAELARGLLEVVLD